MPSSRAGSGGSPSLRRPGTNRLAELDVGALRPIIRHMETSLPTFEAGGVRFVVVPEAVALAHGIGTDPAAKRRTALGKRLRRARVSAKLTQAELGQRLGCAQSSISAVEHGREPCSEARAATWLAACDQNSNGEG